jgi:hypothetical protein
MNIGFRTPETQETQKAEIKEAKKMNDGSVSFPYSLEYAPGKIADHMFRIYKDKNWKVMIENKTKNEGNNKWRVKSTETFELRTGSSDEFLKDLGKALDVYVGPGRLSAREKGIQTYKLLGFWKVLEAEEKIEEMENQEKREVKKALNIETWKALNFEWDEWKKSLSYDYTIIDKTWDRTIKTIFKQEKDKIMVTLNVFNTFRVGDWGTKTVDKTFFVDTSWFYLSS